MVSPLNFRYYRDSYQKQQTSNKSKNTDLEGFGYKMNFDQFQQ